MNAVGPEDYDRSHAQAAHDRGTGAAASRGDANAFGARCNDLTDAGEAFLSALDRNCAPGRETSLARTKVEEAMMWAQRSLRLA